MNKVIIRLLGAIASSYAAYAAAGSVPSNGHTVTAVMSGYEHKGIFLETSKDLANPNNCPNWTSGSKRTIAAIPARSEVDHVLSIALAAKLSQSELDIAVYDDICYEGWPVLRRITIK